MDKDEYLEAWSEDDADSKKEVDPIVESVKAARKMADDEFADAFKNDNFGIDVERVAKQGDEIPADEENKEA